MKLSLDIDSWCEVFTSQAEASGNVFWVSQLDYQKHLFVSPSFKKLWGENSAVMYEHPTYFDTRLVSTDLDSFYKHAIARHNEVGKGSVLFQIKDEKGELRWVRDRFMTLYDSHGKALAAAGIAMDVTDKMDFIKDPTCYTDVLAEHEDIKNNYAGVLRDKLKVLADFKMADQPQLTRRERDCMVNLAKGLSAREAAELLHISRRTVEKHLDNVKLKYSCNNKIELIRILFESGCLEAKTVR